MQAATQFLKILISDAECGRGACIKYNSQVVSFHVFAGEKNCTRPQQTEGKVLSLRCSPVTKENPGLKADNCVILY